VCSESGVVRNNDREKNLSLALIETRTDVYADVADICLKTTTNNVSVAFV